MSSLPKLDKVLERYDELSDLLSNPETMKDNEQFRTLGKEQSEIAPIAEKEMECRVIRRRIEEDEEILKGDDRDLKEIAGEELEELRSNLAVLETEIRELLIPKDPDDNKDVIMEIRAGTGGDEAAVFAGDLYRMYIKFFEKRRWRSEPLSSSPISIGGFKEVIFSVTGKDVYASMKFESGVHRVQRVPVTESGGRIHTSAASVAVLPEADAVEVSIDQADLKVDVFRSTGPGGQSVNTTDSAVRITHLPTGIVVTCQDEKSQHKNKVKALKVLRARLFDVMKAKHDKAIAEERRAQVGTGDRSAKVRTYNFPQNRVTDHRVNLTLYKLDGIINGDLDELIEANRINERARVLEEYESGE